MNIKVNENFYYLIRYIAEFHKAPTFREVYEGKNVGSYLYNIRSGTISISSKDRAYLEKLGIYFEKRNAQEKVHKKLLATVDFLEENQRMPKVKEVYQGFNLYTFLHNIRSGNTSLSKEDEKKLNAALAKIKK